jgi:hypothetical protein
VGAALGGGPALRSKFAVFEPDVTSAVSLDTWLYSAGMTSLVSAISSVGSDGSLIFLPVGFSQLIWTL